MLKRLLTPPEKLLSLISPSVFSIIAKHVTRNQSPRVAPPSRCGRITRKPGTTSAPLTTSSAATRKPPPPVRKRFVLNPTSNWREIICNTRAKWPRPPGNSEREPASRRVWARRWVSLTARRFSNPSIPMGRVCLADFECASLLFRSQQREQDHVADGFRAGEEHGEPIHPETEAAGRRHAVLERQQKFLVDILLLFSRLLNQTLTLHNWIV